ncbi:MAG: YtxH domain-containing protein [SAR202 cluster bacterium]|jgi:gas vesicle protein|nr:YtxH domain-containing protein [SAR202 cluster bacterium]MDP6301880.1 YtxH domain-containing protein [SAR202 cluster bacterium]MDP7105211.1 YtxH domain-containing protein [SAR202 cluster bacterium]MDP7226543.1 YtxH domain-containing protein [SAR202 cluster bacterium]MDP7412585.1 YtxH domain-containing protein [SAR202 cluster bacterium]|tara:strand:- start:6834 stop:7283 length:450 start_codon:yes stop_codon:yes gene_type:complete
MANNDNGGGSFALGLFIGGIIGALIGLLMAPKAGSETRADIWDRSEVLRSRADEAAAGLRYRMGPAFETVSERVVSPAIETVRERGAGAVGTVMSRAGLGADDIDVNGADIEVAEEVIEAAEEAAENVVDSAEQAANETIDSTDEETKA